MHATRHLLPLRVYSQTDVTLLFTPSLLPVACTESTV